MDTKTIVALLTEIRDLLTEIRDHQRANLASQTVLDERREKDRERKRLAKFRGIPRKEKNEEAREEKSPHTPLKGEREEARKDSHTFARAREGFVKPTVAEVAAYCRQRGNFVDPQKWFDFYESKGWLIGKNRMVNWKAAVRTWETKAETEQAGPISVDPKAAAFERQRAENEARKNRSEALAAQYIREINEAISHAH